MNTNGIYIVYNDGSFQPFTGREITRNCKFIGVVCNGHSFGVGRKIGEYQLLSSWNHAKNDDDIKNYDSKNDWDFVNATEYIKQLGCDIPFEDGEYMPTAAVFDVMLSLADKGLNSALSYIGFDPIDVYERYWYSRKYNTRPSWLFRGPNGSLNLNLVDHKFVVQAIHEWNP